MVPESPRLSVLILLVCVHGVFLYFQGSDKQQWISNTDQYARKSSTEGDGSCPGLLLSGQSQTQTIMEKMLV